MPAAPPPHDNTCSQLHEDKVKTASIGTMTDVTLFIISSIKKAALKWAAVKRTAFAKKRPSGRSQGELLGLDIYSSTTSK
jgi:hypothetical protein